MSDRREEPATDVECDHRANPRKVPSLSFLDDGTTLRCYGCGREWTDSPEREAVAAFDVEQLGQVIYEMGVDDLDLPDAQKLARHMLARLSREESVA